MDWIALMAAAPAARIFSRA